MLIGFIFSYSERFFVVFYLSFYFILGQRPSARDEVKQVFAWNHSLKETVKDKTTPLMGQEIATSSPPPPTLRTGQVQPAVSEMTQTARPDCVTCWGLCSASWRAGCMSKWLFMCILTPRQATAALGTLRSALGAVGNCYSKAKAGQVPGAAPIFGLREVMGNFQTMLTPLGGQEQYPSFLKKRKWWPAQQERDP